MKRKPSMFCIPVRCWYFTSLLFLLLAAGCGREALPPQPEESAISLTGSQNKPVATSSEEGDANNILVFGTVLSVVDSNLIIEIPDFKSNGEETENLWWEVRPGLDKDNRTTTVTIGPNTQVEMQDGDLTSPMPNTLLMIAGTWLGDGIAADFIVDHHVIMESASEREGEPTLAEGTWRKLAPDERPEFFDRMPEVQMSDTPGWVSSDFSATSETTLEFPGKYGGPSWAWDSGDIDYVCFPINLLSYACVERVRFICGLGGGHYNFPFSFEADAPLALMVDSLGGVSINVESQRLPGGDLTYYFALGANLQIKWKFCSCGLECDWHCAWYGCWPECDVECNCSIYDWNYNLFGLSQVNSSDSAAPMPEDTLRISDDACPGIDFDPGLDIEPDLASITLCSSQRLIGDCFRATVDNGFGWPLPWEFDGTPVPMYCQPETNPLNITLNDLKYSPKLEIGWSSQLCFAGFTLAQTPVLWLMSGDFQFIPTFNDDCSDFFELQTCGNDQPTEVTLTLPVVPVLTSLWTPNNIVRYGDLVTLQALVKGANGPGSSPKQVSFYSNDEFLATKAIDAQDVATFQTANPIRGGHGVLNPCKHVIRAEYIGHDGQDNTYPTEKSLVLIVTGDAEEVPAEDYWQDQYSGNARTNIGQERLECYLDIVNDFSTVFSEARYVSTVEEAYAVLSPERGTAIDRLDRELLVWWLNFANGGILYTQLIDYNLDGRPDPDWPFWRLMETVEAVRLNPKATAKELEIWAQRLHDILITLQSGTQSSTECHSEDKD